MTHVLRPGDWSRSPIRRLRAFGAVLVVGCIVQLSSERAYWFYSTEWFTTRAWDTALTSLVYAFAVAVPLLILAAVPFSGAHQIVLAGAVFGWTVEGVIVRVLHEGGLFDLFLPAMFVGWHGVLSFFGFFYLVRRWLLDRRISSLALASAGWGGIIGAWAVTTWLPDSDRASESLGAGVRGVEPLEFAVTIALLLVTLGIAHLILDRLWVREWRPGWGTTILTVGATVSLTLIGFTNPWGPIRYLLLVGIPVGALVAGRAPGGSSLFQELSGRIRPRDLWALAPGVVVASIVYAAAWLAAPASANIELARDLLILIQVIVGGAVFVWALLRVVRVNARRESAEVGA